MPSPAHKRIPLLADRTWMERRYVDEGRAFREIAAELGCSHRTVEKYLKRLQIPTRPKGCHRHGHTNGRRKSPTWVSWQGMRDRCSNPRSPRWKYYGGRGITVTPRWCGRMGFENFLADMGERPDGMSLDRIDVDGDYCPENCRWSTPAEQVANRRCSQGADKKPSTP